MEKTKKCTKCNIIKSLSDFETRTKVTGIYPKSQCKQCELDTQRERRRNKGIKARDTRKCRKCKNSQKTSLFKTRVDVCENCVKEDKVIKDNLINGFKKCTKCKKNKPLTEFGIRKYSNYEAIRSDCNKCVYNYIKERRKETSFQLITNLRNRLYQAVKSKNTKKSNNSLELIGCSITFIQKWLEYQFSSNIDWDNYGSYWVVDHVIPCASFNLENEEEQRKCFHWSNLQPLSYSENSSKSDKIIPFTIVLQELKSQYYKKYYT